MSQKERNRKVVLENVKAGVLTLIDAAPRMKVSYRQAKRIYKRFIQLGDIGLLHSLRERSSNRGKASTLKALVLERYQERYLGFGPTLAAEKLAEEGHVIDHETLRRWLVMAGLWSKQRRRKPYRQRRVRRSKFGELLQLDGSHHAWFGDDAPHCCLMNLVDDATGITLALLDKQETTAASFSVLQGWIERYGIPKAIYVDLKTVFISPKSLRGEDADPSAFTHFGKGCERLGIEVIKAYSPQAKGRVERKHALFQDRFVKELALQNIKTIAEANKLLAESFLDLINKKFAILPANPEDAHIDGESYGALNNILCWEYTRKVNNDWTISFEGNFYQLAREQASVVKARQRIMIKKHLSGALSMWSGSQELNFKAIEQRAALISPQKPDKYDITKIRAAAAHKGKANSPWAKMTHNWINRKKRVDFLKNGDNLK